MLPREHFLMRVLETGSYSIHATLSALAIPLDFHAEKNLFARY
jgi:hypothetical protein